MKREGSGTDRRGFLRHVIEASAGVTGAALLACALPVTACGTRGIAPKAEA